MPDPLVFLIAGPIGIAMGLIEWWLLRTPEREPGALDAGQRERFSSYPALLMLGAVALATGVVMQVLT